MVDDYRTEEDTSVLFDDEGHQKYQMLIGMLNWFLCIGRMYVAFATAYLLCLRIFIGRDICIAF